MARSQWKMVSRTKKQNKFRRTSTNFKSFNHIRPQYQDLCTFKNQSLSQSLNILQLASVHKIMKVCLTPRRLLRSTAFYGHIAKFIHNKSCNRFIRTKQPLQVLKATRQLKSKLYSKVTSIHQNSPVLWNKIQRHATRYHFRKLNAKNAPARKPFNKRGKFSTKFSTKRKPFNRGKLKFKR